MTYSINHGAKTFTYYDNKSDYDKAVIREKVGYEMSLVKRIKITNAKEVSNGDVLCVSGEYFLAYDCSKNSIGAINIHTLEDGCFDTSLINICNVKMGDFCTNKDIEIVDIESIISIEKKYNTFQKFEQPIKSAREEVFFS